MHAAKPDFVIVGGQQGDKFFLLASRKVGQISISSSIEYEDIYSMWGAELLRSIAKSRSTEISADVKDFIMVLGDSYAQVWEELFRCWSPPGPPEIEGQKAIN